MAKRTKAPVMQPISSQAAENVMADFATADAKIAEINAKMDQRITAIREEYAAELKTLGDKHEEARLKLQLWAEQNPDAFTKKKSLDMAHGTLGFRTGTPKLKLSKGFTWAAVLNLLEKTKDLAAYVRVVKEVAKDKLLADRDLAKIKSRLNKDGIGCEVVQDETFFIELKKEETVAA